MPTLRAALLLMIAAPLLATAAWFPAMLWVAIAYVLLIVGAIAWDQRAAQDVATLPTIRSHDNRLSLGADNTITLSIRNRQARPITFWLRDEPPDAWVDGATALHDTIPARDEWTGTYTVHPLRRGDYDFGNLTLRWLSPRQLWTRQQRIPHPSAVKVYPNLLDVRKYDLLMRRNRLQEIGLRNSRRMGEGTEYERLREYTPDDDFRRIDWKATARRHKPITVEYQVERSQNIIAVLDVGRMMQSPVGNIAKLDYVINATLLLGYVATGMGDKVGLMTLADDVETFLAPKQGRAQFYRMLEQLYAVEAQSVEPDFGRTLPLLARKQRKRSLIVLFTDLNGGNSVDQLVANIGMLARQHLPLVVTISDPDVVAASQEIPADTQTVYRRAAAANLLEERRLILEALGRRGVQTLDVPANQLSLAVIQRYLDIKRKTLL